MSNLTWQQVTAAPEWGDLDAGQRDAVRTKFFSDVIQPNIPDGTDAGGVQKDFFTRTQNAMTPEAGFLTNVGRGLERGASRAFRGLSAAGEGARELMNPFEPDAVRQSYQGQVFGMGDKARQFEDSIPAAQTTRGKIAQGIGGFGAGIVTAGAGEPGAAGEDVLARGGSLSRAEGSAGISAVGNELGLATGNLGGRFASRLALQTTAGGAITEGSRRAENALSPADEQQAFDPVTFGLGAGGAALGAFAHGPLSHGDDLLAMHDAASPLQREAPAPESATPNADVGDDAARDAYHSAIDPSLLDLPDEQRNTVADILTTPRVGGQRLDGLKNFADFSARQQLGTLPKVVGTIDADGFKAINDHFGHETGDEVIRQIGAALSDSFGGDAAWHRSGDEFHVAAHSDEDFDAAQAAAQEAAGRIRITATLPDGSVISRTGVGLSFGRGANTQEAEHGLQQNKLDRLAAGLRTERRANSEIPSDTRQGEEGAGLQPPADGAIPRGDEGSDEGSRRDGDVGEEAAPQSDEVNQPANGAPQAQAAGVVPNSDDAIKAIDDAIANRTTTGALHDFLMKVAPMAAGTDESRAIAKDFANETRAARFEGDRADRELVRGFKLDQLRRMFDAANEQSELEQQGAPTDGRGLDTLSSTERAAVDKLQVDAKSAFDEAKEHGLVSPDAESIPSYTPRMLVKLTDTGAERFNTKGSTETLPSRLRTMTGNLLRRKHATAADTESAAKGYDDNASLVRDIRVLPLATARLRQAIAGRKLVNAIKTIGEKHGVETVAEGRDPTKANERWFTMPEHQAFYTQRPTTVNAKMREAHDQHLWDGLHRLAEKLGVDPKRVASMRAGRWGEASRLEGVTTRFAGPETVLTHELGHIMDFKYGLADLLTRRGATAKELRALADLRYEGSEPSQSYKRYVRTGTEKIANMVHAYVHMPERFREVAPHTFEAFENFLGEHSELDELKKLKPSLVLGSRSQDVPVTHWERVPIFIRGDFEGPLRAVLGEKQNGLYRGLMDIKARAMSNIMFSPALHLMTELGRALPAMPGKVLTLGVLRDGAHALGDAATMREAIHAGMAPIGRHGAFNDVTSIVNEPRIKPGRSITSQVLSFIPNLFDKNAGDAVKRAVDHMGDLWHNKLLWDQIAKLQAGIYTNFRDQMVREGMQPRAAQIVSAHLANRFAGALPMEAMSKASRKIANLVLFSRTFTLGNLGVMKDALTGLPKDAQAQILRDAGQETLNGALKFAKRKARSTILLDIGLMYATNSILQSAVAIMSGNSSLDRETKGYLRRFAGALQKAKENPFNLLDLPAAVSSTSENEPGKTDRILIGHADDGTAIYLRNPVGKIGEEFSGWLTGPLDMLKKKLSTFARPTLQTLANDQGFGRKVYDDVDDTSGANMRRLGRIAALFIGSQFPLTSLKGAADFYAGRGDATINAARVLGPLTGITVSQGAPGGPAVGDLYQARASHEFNVQQAMPAIREKIRAGDVAGGMREMLELGMNPKLAEWEVKVTLNPSLRLSAHQLQDFMQYAAPEQRERMLREMQGRR